MLSHSSALVRCGVLSRLASFSSRHIALTRVCICFRCARAWRWKGDWPACSMWVETREGQLRMAEGNPQGYPPREFRCWYLGSSTLIVSRLPMSSPLSDVTLCSDSPLSQLVPMGKGWIPAPPSGCLTHRWAVCGAPSRSGRQARVISGGPEKAPNNWPQWILWLMVGFS